MFGLFQRKAKKVGDPFFREIGTPLIPVYQKHFERVLQAIDLDVQTAWADGKKSYDRKRFRQDEEAMERIIAVEAVREGVIPAALQVMVNQFFFADPYKRNADRHRWVQRVMQRNDMDYFPDGWAVRKLLDAVT